MGSRKASPAIFALWTRPPIWIATACFALWCIGEDALKASAVSFAGETLDGLASKIQWLEHIDSTSRIYNLGELFDSWKPIKLAMAYAVA
jgi:hypothetical protein